MTTDVRTEPPAGPPDAAAPDWLLRPQPGLCARGPSPRRRRATFLAKTLAAAIGLLTAALDCDTDAAAPGLLQRLDPRTKLAALFVSLLALAFVRDLTLLAAAYLLTLPLARAGRIPLGAFVRRVWLSVPLFTGVAVAPATLSVVTAGPILVPLWNWQATTHGITSTGLAAAALIVLRVAASVSLVVLVALTTPWTRLLGALQVLRVPAIFVMVVGMAYRYLFLLATVLADMITARTARTVAPTRHDRSARRFVGASVGALLGKAHQMSEDVHDAMIARGWTGTAYQLQTERFARVDLLATLGVVTVCVILLTGDRLLGH